MPQAAKLQNSATALFNEHDMNFMRNAKEQRKIESVLKCYKELYNQEVKIATQVSVKRFFKEHPKPPIHLLLHLCSQPQLQSLSDLKMLAPVGSCPPSPAPSKSCNIESA
jgi:hypothetical protein